MINTGKLAGLTVFVTGGSRGIGKAIALKAARDGANVVVAAKTAEPHPKLPGTIYTACSEIEAAGGKCLPCVVDVRDEGTVRKAVEEAANKFGGIDILINNASAIQLVGTEDIDMKRYDLMHHINTRGTFLTTKVCLPYLKKSKHAHVLNLSPPLNMQVNWFQNHVAYTMAKYGMSMCVLGMHEEFRPFNIGVNALWPRTTIATAAIEMLQGSESVKNARKPEIMSDAAYAILIQDPRKVTGNFFIDERVLFQNGITDFDQYCNDVSQKDNLSLDFFLSEEEMKPVIASSAPKKEAVSDAKPKDVTGIFKMIEGSLNEDLVNTTKAIYVFEVTGKEEGKWFIDLKTGSGSCGQGEPSNPADATLRMDSKHFFDMFTGRTKPATAYMMGKLKIKGNLQKAMKLEKLMGKLKSKIKLAGLTVFVTGASRGIGKAIALKAARDGANIVIAAKTAQPHPKLEGTIYTAAEEIEKAGGKCLPCIVDIRNEDQVKAAVQAAVQKFGGIDILVNNASAISLTPTEETEMKRYDLMHNINTRGTFLVTKLCLPHLKKSKHAHILNISPPLNMNPRWFDGFVAYTMAKYGMSMCVLGMHAEFKPYHIAVNALWPRTAIHTAAIEMLSGKESAYYSRKADIMADAAYHIFQQDPKKVTGNFFIDENVVVDAGVKDLTQYACHPENVENLHVDFFLDDSSYEKSKL